ncbi:t-SNARE [Polyplosphaeria fusca]|uniref:t-SNARE n=1 Tax=Polyplosphaeria fusca TaxID=682080 RepID=A0A9P4RB67_9PLEO|nr:t-SNARE [Polyplosphaeria fusca]
MSYGGYQQYGGNPYGQEESGYGGPNLYGGTQGNYQSANPYGGNDDHQLNPPPPPLQHGDSAYSQGSQYSMPSHPPTHQGTAPLSQQDFLSLREGAMSRINQLSSNIQQIASIHQRLLSSPDSGASAQLEALVTDTQKMNTGIKDEIKSLERDAAREPNNKFKKTQVDSLKRTFKRQLEDFQKEESDYSKRYRDAIARQYRIVNPDATEQEVQEAANANWGDEGIFQTALKSNRTGQASSVLGAVRARHQDIQRIEQTLSELALLFTQLNEQVVYQETQVAAAEEQTEGVQKDTERANDQLTKGVASARRARKLKWWALGIVVLIVAALALGLGIYFGTRDNGKNNNNTN